MLRQDLGRDVQGVRDAVRGLEAHHGLFPFRERLESGAALAFSFGEEAREVKPVAGKSGSDQSGKNRARARDGNDEDTFPDRLSHQEERGKASSSLDRQ